MTLPSGHSEPFPQAGHLARLLHSLPAFVVVELVFHPEICEGKWLIRLALDNRPFERCHGISAGALRPGKPRSARASCPAAAPGFPAPPRPAFPLSFLDPFSSVRPDRNDSTRNV
jgi:hypothetical protein